jgi:molybdopterin/thiamine biosynthesis adenylyltransferase/rhodanese-related sulfurtransferase
MKTFTELLKETKGQISELTPAQVKEKIDFKEPVTLLDVREKDEVAQGYIEDSVTIPRGFLEQKVENAIPERNTPIIVYCAAGTRSAMAAKTLKEMGYTDVTSMSGGFSKWKESGFNFVKNEAFTQEQLTRYSRQVLLPEVGEKGQAKLLKSKVLMIGAGGLGSPIAYYLAAAGVGTLGIIDPDVVDLSNLHRQILHMTDKVGEYKVDSAKETINKINPGVNVRTYKDFLTSENALEIIRDYDIVVDGSDNFAAKFLINDACYFTGKPNVYGSIFQFEGQITVFNPTVEGPCYRCLFPAPPPAGLAPNCAEAGVLGILPGTIGVLQAVEVVKLILGKGEPLIGRLMLYDSLNASFRTLKIKKDPDCALCGENRTIDKLIDYENFCSI